MTNMSLPSRISLCLLASQAIVGQAAFLSSHRHPLPSHAGTTKDAKDDATLATALNVGLR
eukprot:CAMPEP_0119545292 /NCGR_PEP_ID=MMETSP1352-20130426/67_1 /TAXON_ID=265584 /ORGANISM="Stauroneis constricta, Strain CCMP1120" /LENGTH=59 /DNA_ID=CAMNT_0007589819 /DNA_START=91 /DNA_END=267 /DNA_ORIENTATION=+